MAAGILFAVLTGLTWALISMTMSVVARHKISVFLFYWIGNTAAALIAWIFVPDWRSLRSLSFSALFPLLLLLTLAGFVNVASQAFMVLTLKLGHNGISIAVRNCAALIPFLIGVLVWHNEVGLLNIAGLLMLLGGLVMIALGNRSNGEADLRRVSWKWLLAVAASLGCSGAFQTLNSLTARLAPELLNTGLRVPMLLTSCALGNCVASLLRGDMAQVRNGVPHVIPAMALGWSLTAIGSYYFMFRSLDSMNAAGASALVFPIVIGVNISTFSLYSKFRLKEPYSVLSVTSLLLCLFGIILLTWK